MNNGLPKSTNYRSLNVTADDTLYASTDAGLYKSVDKGANWALADNTLRSPQSVMEASDGTLYCGSVDGVYTSSDKGSTWKKTWSSNGIYAPTAYSFIETTDGTVYAGVYMGDIIKSTDKGGTWTSVSQDLSKAGVRAVMPLVVAKDGAFYAGTDTKGVFKSTDKGVTWKAINQGLDSKYYSSSGIVGFVIMPDGTLFAGMYGYVATSADNGATWTDATNGLLSPKGAQGFCLSADGTLYSGGISGKVYRWDGTAKTPHIETLTVNGTGGLPTAGTIPTPGQTSSGPTSIPAAPGQTLVLNITPSSDDDGATGQIYVGAYIGNVTYFMDANNKLIKWDQVSQLTPYKTGVLKGTTSVNLGTLDLTGISGWLGIGYGVGSGAAADGDMLNNQKYSIWTIK